MRHTLLALALATTAALPAHANWEHRFDTDAQGWTVFDGGDLVWQGTGGNTGGFLQVTDATFGDFEFIAPASVLGNWSGYLGGTLWFDAKNINGFAPTWPLFGTLRLVGANNVTLSLDIAAENLPAVGADWRRFSVLLDTATWGAQLPSVLANVQTLALKGEFHNGLGEVVGFDNIGVSAVPEPGAFVLMGLGLLVLGARARARKGAGA